VKLEQQQEKNRKSPKHCLIVRCPCFRSLVDAVNARRLERGIKQVEEETAMS
jgi:hypothetical protein